VPAAGEATVQEVGERVRAALESSDLVAYRDLLDPEVRWGAPEDPEPSCQNRDQVLAWYRRGREAGIRGEVTEVVAGTGKLLVGLRVSGSPAALDRGGSTDRWQVLTVAGGRVVDIRAYDDRSDAAAAAGVDG
jgi:ketosteroid isomerase-like protein